MRKISVILFLLVFVIACTSSFKTGSVTLITDDNLKIAGDLIIGEGYQPLKDEKPAGEMYKAGVILLHNLEGSKETYKNLAVFLNSKGFTTLAIDFRGHGSSTGIKEDYSKYENEIDAAVQLFKSQNYEEIYLIGGSIGANTAVRYAASHPEIKRIVLLSPGMDYHGITIFDVINNYRGELYIIAPEGIESEVKLAWDLKEYYLGTKKLLVLPSNEHGDQMVKTENGINYVQILWFLTR